RRHPRLARQLPAQRHTRRVHGLAKDLAGRVGKVNVLEHAMRLLGCRIVKAAAADAVVIDGDDLPRLDVANVCAEDSIERARLAGDTPAPIERLAERQRPYTPRISASLD